MLEEKKGKDDRVVKRILIINEQEFSLPPKAFTSFKNNEALYHLLYPTS